jgi:hypothetical protein
LTLLKDAMSAASSTRRLLIVAASCSPKWSGRSMLPKVPAALSAASSLTPKESASVFAQAWTSSGVLAEDDARLLGLLLERRSRVDGASERVGEAVAAEEAGGGEDGGAAEPSERAGSGEAAAGEPLELALFTAERVRRPARRLVERLHLAAVGEGGALGRERLGPGAVDRAEQLLVRDRGAERVLGHAAGGRVVDLSGLAHLGAEAAKVDAELDVGTRGCVTEGHQRLPGLQFGELAAHLGLGVADCGLTVGLFVRGGVDRDLEGGRGRSCTLPRAGIARRGLRPDSRSRTHRSPT